MPERPTADHSRSGRQRKSLEFPVARIIAIAATIEHNILKTHTLKPLGGPGTTRGVRLRAAHLVGRERTS
jgi:hypothetical protein